ncbi:MAG: carboxypeptidase regulatory-like domain-containing protein [Fibrobacteria bacterium]|nr:carboxypeptidase regulatory-like domain-containing protein [Fibrobacteria bacterium]
MKQIIHFINKDEGSMKKSFFSTIFILLFAVMSIQAASISGTVTDAEGDEPLSGAIVVVTTFGFNPDTIAIDTSAGDGSYFIDGLENERYRVAAVLANYTNMAVSIRIQGSDVTRDLQMTKVDNSGEISGTVTKTDGGEPISGAKVRLLQGGFGGDVREIDTTSTDAEGNYSFSAVVVGQTYFVEAAATDFVTDRSEPVLVLGEPNDVDISLAAYVPPAGGISGVVSNTDEEPLADVSVSLRVREVFNGSWEIAATVTTGADGKYTFEALEPATAGRSYTIIATKADYRDFNSEMVAVAAEVVTLNIEMTAITKGNLHVLVAKRSDNEPISGATVTAALEVTDGAIYTGTTDDNGRISFTDALTGNYTLTVTATGYVTDTQGRMLSENEEDSSTILLDVVTDSNSKTISGIVENADEEPISGVTITLQISSGRDLITMLATSGDDGSYSIAGIPQEYSNGDITASITGFITYEGRITFDRTETTRNITLEEDLTGILDNATQTSMQMDLGGSHILQITNVQNNTRLLVYSLTGRVLESRILVKGNHSVPLPEYVSGSVFFVRLLSGSQELNGKFLVH